MLGSFETLGAVIFVIVSVAGAFWGLIRSGGKARAEIEALRDGAKAERERNEVDATIRRDADAKQRLRSGWTRK